MRIGIVGNGYVGRATALLKCQDIDVVIYDKNPDLCMPLGVSLNSLKDCNFIFVCVPTPMKPDGSCDTTIVEAVVSELSDDYPVDRIVIRSTVPVGTCKQLGTMFLPEFLTERNWKNDFKNTDNWVLGWSTSRSIADEFYEKILETAYSCGVFNKQPKVSYCSTNEAETIKYVKNCFLATKVSFFNEIESFCVAKNIDYDKVRQLVALDDRIGLSHTQVPGPDGKKGYGGTCFPKDIASLQYQMNTSGIQSYILDSTRLRNEGIDRPSKDWELDKGRAVV